MLILLGGLQGDIELIDAEYGDHINNDRADTLPIRWNQPGLAGRVTAVSNETKYDNLINPIENSVNKVVTSGGPRELPPKPQNWQQNKACSARHHHFASLFIKTNKRKPNDQIGACWISLFSKT
ncbi:MAG: hypothetical protein IPJ90_23940 [Anaerolineaceae bacterium]|nr:hypothetical protein [Anaerolineaceae bacterium]